MNQSAPTTKAIPVVCGIGSCRTQSPLRFIQKRGLVMTRHDNEEWYSYSAPETLQKFDIVNGRRKVSPSELPFLMTEPEKFIPRVYGPGNYDLIDYAYVEVSSAKVYYFEDWIIQQWCLRTLLLNARVDMARFNAALNKPQNQRDVSFLPSDTPEIIKRITASCSFKRQTAEEIYADLHSIDTQLRTKLVLIPSVNLEGSDGRLLPERVLVNEVLAQYAKDKGHIFFDPAPHVRAYGRNEAMSNIYHYRLPFLERLGELFYELIRPG